MNPYSPSDMSVRVEGVAVREAMPKRLWRKNNKAAVLEFDVPIFVLQSRHDGYLPFRQGSLIELVYAVGPSVQRLFYGYLPSEGADLSLKDSAQAVHFTATDFIGQLQSRIITLGDSSSSFLDFLPFLTFSAN